MKKRLLLLSVVLSCLAIGTCYAALPDDGETLYLYTKATKEAAVYSLDELNKITFSDKGVQIWNTSWPTEYAYSNVRVITFSEKKTPTGIEQVEKSDEEKFNDSKGIYDLQGRKLNTMQRGVNIIRMGDGTTRKVIVK